MKGSKEYRWILALVGIILINVFVFLQGNYNSAINSEDYILDDASKKLVQNISNPVIITFFRSENLSPREASFADKVEEVLNAYKSYSDTTFNIEVVNPMQNLETELDATNAGIKPIEVREGSNELRRFFLGLIIQVGSRIEVIPIVTPKVGIEYLISSSLRKLGELHRKRIAYVMGHHEPPLNKLKNIEKMLRPNYDLTPVHLNSSLDITAFESLVIVSPYLPFSDNELHMLDEFIAKGKNIFMALDRVGYDSELQEAYAINTRLEEWLRKKGLLVPAEFLVDNFCGDVQLDAVVTPITFPYFPQITDFSFHPVNSGVQVIVLKYASPILPIPNIEGKYTPLARTSSVSGIKNIPLHINLSYEWSRRDYNAPRQTIAGLLEMKASQQQGDSSKLIVLSDADILSDNQSANNLTDNYLFVTNAIDWLSDSLELVSIKQKGIVKQNNTVILEPVDSWVKFLNLLLPLFFVAIWAFYSLYIRPKKLQKKQRENLD